ncbi:MAG: ORF6N domain-containing protein [Bacteroidales bacterium]|nr:ORF6N domain-containing protein [Bacteroidales bacterium]
MDIVKDNFYNIYGKFFNFCQPKNVIMIHNDEKKQSEIVAESEIVNQNLTTTIENRILTIRGLQVMSDYDLAELYGVETKRLNEQVRRNINRFPERFRFQLNKNEMDELVANCDRFKTLKHSTVPSYVFTEQGIAMLSSVLKTETAIQTSISIIDAFVAMRHFLSTNVDIFSRLEILEHHQLEMQQHQNITDKRMEEVFQLMDRESPFHTNGIFYDGQIFDAHTFVCGLIREAKQRIILIDNYIDDTVLQRLDKRQNGVSVTIYTQRVTRILQTDINTHNAQYPPIEVRVTSKAHDRFIVIDDIIYHIGASIKDLGKKSLLLAK